jgi:hypothetical protein
MREESSGPPAPAGWGKVKSDQSTNIWENQVLDIFWIWTFSNLFYKKSEAIN